ncbi:MAG: 23S rRNA (pseudouridine(1915)-N(3))-methyltransferase RlmH [Gemmatimonadota bacterium]
MKVQLVVVGKVKGELKSPVSEYERRAGRYWKFSVDEVAAGGKSSAPSDVMAAEAERIEKRLDPSLELVALAVEGTAMSSETLADYLETLQVRSSAGVAFVIGGAFGIAPGLKARARRTLSLSGMTLPHEMARLVLAEQLYRAGTILRGEPYHKG